MEYLRSEAWERVGVPGLGPFLFTCEHASNRIPAPLRTTAADRALMVSHHAWDIGGRVLARTLALTTGSCAVLARFSRLVVDANREPAAADLIRTEVEGHPLSFNVRLDGAERRRRIATYHEPYHDAVDRTIRHHTGPPPLLVSLHTFTPVWAHQLRAMDLGVLYDAHEPLALRTAHALRREGFEVALNAPYSGKDGLIYAARRHGETHGLAYLELELNQAVVSTPHRARRVAHRIARALRAVWEQGRPRGPAPR